MIDKVNSWLDEVIDFCDITNGKYRTGKAFVNNEGENYYMRKYGHIKWMRMEVPK